MTAAMAIATVSGSGPATPVRTVDLFAGCGGLALGFERSDRGLDFETVLAADIDPVAVRTFNANFPKDDGGLPTGRLCDLSWFSHRSEVVLYYLAHLAEWAGDEALDAELAGVGYHDFLRRIKAADDRWRHETSDLVTSDEFRAALRDLAPGVATVALFKGVLKRLGIRSLRSLDIDGLALPWVGEYERKQLAASADAVDAPDPVLLEAAEDRWADAVARIAGAADAVGRGQHRSVAAKMSSVDEMLGSPVGLQLRQIWIRWRATRDSIRAGFCLASADALQSLYSVDRQVGLIIGGPPCKGWSRIGRAVIESLREQGVHAWACPDYGDERNALLHDYVLFLDALRPKMFVFENVAHFESELRTPNGSVRAADVLQSAVAALDADDSGYVVGSKVVRARRHGIPQDRERYVLVGVLGKHGHAVDAFFEGLTTFDDDVPLSAALNGLEGPGVFDPADRERSDQPRHRVRAFTLVDPRQPASYVRYIDWIRQREPRTGADVTTTDAHIVRRLRTDDANLYGRLAPGTRWMDYKFDGMPTLERLRRSLEQSGAEPDLLGQLDDSLLLRLLLEAVHPVAEEGAPHHLLSAGYLAKGADRHGDWLERLSPDRPCKTIVAHIGKDTYGYIHPTQARALSIREAARVQSFPDWFSFGAAGVVDAYSMIGNAVPPLLAYDLAGSVAGIDARFGLFSSSRTDEALPESA